MRAFGYATLWGQVDLDGEYFEAGAFSDGGLTSYPSIYLVNAHDTSQVAGILARALETPEGLYVEVDTFATAAGVDADRLLDGAKRAGAQIGLSVGFLRRAQRPGPRGTMAITKAILLHVALTPQPALPMARLGLGTMPLAPAAGKAFDAVAATRQAVQVAAALEHARSLGVSL